jgi:lactosylceramide 4-alpha-galactosyltransferase
LKIEHASDIFRLATLYKFGGIYMDLDCLVMRPLTDLSNAVASEMLRPLIIANGVIIFDKGHPFLVQALAEISNRCVHHHDIKL